MIFGKLMVCDFCKTYLDKKDEADVLVTKLGKIACYICQLRACTDHNSSLNEARKTNKIEEFLNSLLKR